MAELKTKLNAASVKDFINAIEDEQKRKDCFDIIDVLKDASKQEPKMWGENMVGFGEYHYKYDSGHEGDMFWVGFAPRKSNITLYVGGTDLPEIKDLGKYKAKGSCIHITKLEHIDKKVLKSIAVKTIKKLSAKYK